MNIFDVLKGFNIEDLKKRSAETLSKMKEVEITGESGGGFVKVTINGEFYITDIEYEENSFIKDDLATFKDLIIAATNQAVDKMKDELQKSFLK